MPTTPFRLRPGRAGPRYVVGLSHRYDDPLWAPMSTRQSLGTLFHCATPAAAGQCLQAAVSASSYSDGVTAALGIGFMPDRSHTVVWPLGQDDAWVVVAYPPPPNRRRSDRGFRPVHRVAGLPCVYYGFGGDTAKPASALGTVDYAAVRIQAASFFDLMVVGTMI